MLRLANMTVILIWSALHLSSQTAVASTASTGSPARMASSFLGRRSAQKDKDRVETFKRYVRGAGTHPDAANVSCGSTLGNTETNNFTTCTANIQVPQGTISLAIEVVEVAGVEIYAQTCGTGGSSFCEDSLTLTISGPDSAVLFSESLTTNGGPLPAVPNPPFVPIASFPNGDCGTTWNCYSRVFGGSLGVGQYTANGPAVITVTQTYVGLGEYDTSGLVLYIPPGGNVIDPVPDLLTGNGILQDPESLATLGTPVMGVAADGAARVVLRVPASNVGDSVVLTLFNDSTPPAESSSPASDGLLGTIDGSTTASQIQVTAVSTNSGPMAFALYFPPTDFARNGNAADPTVYQRPVYIQTKDNQTSAQGELPVMILRPPVLLVHGLWGAPGDLGFLAAALSSDPIFCPQACMDLADYSFQTPISNQIPSSVPSVVPGGALGFGYNAPLVLSEIAAAIVDFRTSNNAAAAQVDAVAHSMGGDIIRMLSTLAAYQDWTSFGVGSVHKLITIGTPYLGSPVATQLFQAQNSCPVAVLAAGGNVSIAGAVVGGVPVTGATFDLEGDGVGGGLSAALLTLQSGGGPGVSTAAIAATTLPANLITLDSCVACGAFLIHSGCPSTSPLAQGLTSTAWPGVLGGTSDAIVPTTSQLNNSSGFATEVGLIHSSGLVALGFTGPSELDAITNVPGDVVALLNSPISSVFRIIH